MCLHVGTQHLSSNYIKWKESICQWSQFTYRHLVPKNILLALHLSLQSVQCSCSSFPHITVVSSVQVYLTFSGVSKSKRCLHLGKVSSMQSCKPSKWLDCETVLQTPLVALTTSPLTTGKLDTKCPTNTSLRCQSKTCPWEQTEWDLGMWAMKVFQTHLCSASYLKTSVTSLPRSCKCSRPLLLWLNYPGVYLPQKQSQIQRYILISKAPNIF